MYQGIDNDTLLECLLAGAASEDSVWAYIEGTVDELAYDAALERSIDAEMQRALEAYANTSYPEWWVL